MLVFRTATISVCKQCRIALFRQFHGSQPMARSIKKMKAYGKRRSFLAAKERSSTSVPYSRERAARTPSEPDHEKPSVIMPFHKLTPEDVRLLLRRFLPKWIEAPETIKMLTTLGLEAKDARMVLGAYEIHMAEILARRLSSNEDEDPWSVLHLWTGEESDKYAIVRRGLTTQLFEYVSQPDLEIIGVKHESLQILKRAYEALDLRFPAEAFPVARARTRKVYLHVGPTNSGKTYNALRALASAPSGVYAGPLRLLAHEVWERLNRGSIRPHDAHPSTAHLYARACNLITGEEQRIVSVDANLTSCTVEMVNLFKHWSVCVIDEIQMIADPQRGSSWTAAVLGVCADELHLCGEEAAVPLIESLMRETGDELIVKRYERLTPLVVATESLGGRWERIEKGDCVVTFSRRSIFELKRQVEQATGLRCAVAYGRLPPETRSEQAALFNDRTSGYDVIVATDAIGMGLNLKIKRIVFVQLSKHNGIREIPLSLSQVKQIGGRAGRFGEHGDASSNGVVTCLYESDLPMLSRAFETHTPDLRKAIVPFHLSVLIRIAQFLPDTFGLHQLTSLLHMAGRLSTNYSLRQDESLWKGMDVIDRCGSDLRLVEKMQFAVSPTTWRSDLEVETFETYLRQYTSGEPVDLRDSLEESHLLATLGTVTQSRMEHQQTSPGRKVLGSARGYKVQNSETLATLETLHRVLINYIWLAFRLPVSFHQQPDAIQLKEETEAGIEFILEGIGNPKVRRRSKTLSLLRAENREAKIQYKGKEETRPMLLRRLQQVPDPHVGLSHA